MDNFNLFKYLNILLEQQQKPVSFIILNEMNNWQFFIQKFGTNFSISNLFIFDWWQIILYNFQIFETIFIFVDLLLYLSFFFILIQFGILYSKNSSNFLLITISKYSKIFIFFIWILLSFSLIFTFFNKINLFGSFFILHNLFYINYFSQISKFFLIIIWLGLFKYINTLSKFNQGISELPLLFSLILCLSFTLTSCGDLGLFFICLEGFSLILYIMTTIGRIHGGIASAAKYFSFGTAGSILIIWGITNLYSIISSLSFKVIYFFFEFNNNDTQTTILTEKLNWSGSLILLGFLIKLGAAPLHQWVVDVYSGVPLFITAFFSIFVKFILFIVFLRIAYLFNTMLELEYASILSLIIGCFGTLKQVELKRFLAYSSITHVGFLLAGDLSASIMYLATYLISSFVFFSILLNTKINNNKELIYLSDLKYLSIKGTFLDKILLTITLASMSGLPPFAGFYGKMFVWSSLIEDIYLFNDYLSFLLLILNLIISLIIIFYYMRLINYLFLGSESSNNNFIFNSNLNNFNKSLTFIQYFILILLCFWTILMPYFNTLLILFTENIILF